MVSIRTYFNLLVFHGCMKHTIPCLLATITARGPCRICRIVQRHGRTESLPRPQRASSNLIVKYLLRSTRDEIAVDASVMVHVRETNQLILCQTHWLQECLQRITAAPASQSSPLLFLEGIGVRYPALSPGLLWTGPDVPRCLSRTTQPSTNHRVTTIGVIMKTCPYLVGNASWTVPTSCLQPLLLE
jgi:hypothetical protein